MGGRAHPDRHAEPPGPGIEPMTLALEALRLNHWTTREVGKAYVFNFCILASYGDNNNDRKHLLSTHYMISVHPHKNPVLQKWKLRLIAMLSFLSFVAQTLSSFVLFFGTFFKLSYYIHIRL